MMQVTLVGSIGFSGSTMLDVMLGNGKDCFACGEVYALFDREPPICTCGDPVCSIWSSVKEIGREGFYQYLFDLGYERVSDSSKSRGWFKYQNHILSEKGVKVNKVLLYKHPLNLIYSHWRRRRTPDVNRWYRYNRDFHRLFHKDYHVISYEDLVTDPPDVLKRLCDALDYPYFEGKERFWEDISHHLYGSLSTRIHFYDIGSERYEALNRNLRRRRRGLLHSVKFHRIIHNVQEWEENLPQEFRKLPANIGRMLARLEKKKL